jgi:hypothetical protein
MDVHQIAEFHSYDAIPPVIIAAVFVLLSSLLKEPGRRNFNAVMVAGAGAAYLSGGGLGIWEFAFTAMVTFCAYKGLQSYRYISIGWLLHTGWDLVHHFYGNPLIPFDPLSSAGCAITDALIAIWFFADAPSVFDSMRKLRARA